MHPITVIEIIMSIVFIIVIFVIPLLLPNKLKKLGLLIAFSLTLLLLSFFAIRPYWIDYQVSKKTEKLNQYLEEKYPNQEWKIHRRVGRQYNPYDLEVKFKNEKGWTYTYSVVNEQNICQSGWATPEGKRPKDGKHYESNHCN